jgi:hypothetical protein
MSAATETFDHFVDFDNRMIWRFRKGEMVGEVGQILDFGIRWHGRSACSRGDFVTQGPLAQWELELLIDGDVS